VYKTLVFSSSVLSRKRRPYVRIKCACANERLNRVASFRLNSVKKREFCEKRLKDSQEFREYRCYENCNYAVQTVISLWARMKFCPNSLRFSFGAGSDGDGVSSVQNCYL
jgi:hypothetical protein